MIKAIKGEVITTNNTTILSNNFILTFLGRKNHKSLHAHAIKNGEGLGFLGKNKAHFVVNSELQRTLVGRERG